MKEYKARSQETHKELQQQLLAAKKEAKDIQEQFNNYKDEMSELQETIELSALDKEMAEEKVHDLYSILCVLDKPKCLQRLDFWLNFSEF